MDNSETLARKFLEALPPDGHFNPGVPGWGAEAVVKAFLAGVASARAESVRAKGPATREK